MRKIRSILEFLSATVLIILLLLSIAGVAAVKFYGDDLKHFVMDQINMQLDTKVDLEKISVSVFQNFPHTTIRMEEVQIWSSPDFDAGYFQGTAADTLLHAQEVDLSFNLLALLRKRYAIRRLELKNGEIHMLTDPGGQVNFHILKQRKTGQGEKIQEINLSQLKIINFGLILDNRAKEIYATGNLKRLELNGRYSEKESQIKGALAARLDEITNKGIIYASKRNVEARIQMEAKDGLYTIKSGQFHLDRILADIDGTLERVPDLGVQINLFASARNLEIHEVLDLLPAQFSERLQGIRGNGILQLHTRINGWADATRSPQIEAEFQTSRAHLNWERLPFSLKGLNLSGTYSNGDKFNPSTARLRIESFEADIGEDHILANGQVTNFYDPDFNFVIQGDIHPGQWIRWYEEIPLHEASGLVSSDMRISGSYNRLQEPGHRFLSFDLAGQMVLHDVDLLIHKKSLPFTGLSGKISIENDLWKPSLTGNFGENDFQFSGTGLNLLSFLMKKEEHLSASATLTSRHIDLQRILDHFPTGKERQKSAFFFPQNLHLKLDFQFDEFVMDRFHAQKVNGTASYDAPFFQLDALSMETMEGFLSGDYGMIQNEDGDIFIQVNAGLNGLDIQQLFYSFYNFRQDQLTEEHLSGHVSGSCVFSADFNPDFSLRPESIRSENSLVIEQGELKHFEPILALSRFIDVEELENIEFETLENNILIKDSQVIIPQMDIHTNALNLTASGTHSFNRQYDYRLRLSLSELLYNKAQSNHKSEFQVARDASDQRTLFLKVYNHGKGSRVEIDRDRTAEKIRSDLKEEKQELKQILNEELGLFKKDSSIENTPSREKEGTEIWHFEFEEEEDSLGTPPVKKKKRGRLFKRTLKKDSTENNNSLRFVIDE